MSYFVDIMKARGTSEAIGIRRPSTRLPAAFGTVADAIEGALSNMEENRQFLNEWSYNVVDECGNVVVTADDLER